MMKMTVLYHSVTGNTKTMAQVIAEGMMTVAGVEAKAFPIENWDLAVAGHADDAVGPAQAGDGARAARQGHGKEGVVHPAQLDADAFFHAGAGGQRIDGQGRDRFAVG